MPAADPLDPRGLLLHVHPDLVKVARAALQLPQPFFIVYGIRTLAAEAEAVRTGHSTTMHSRHLPNAAGVACAIDVEALTDGKPDWAPHREAAVYGHIAVEMKAAAANLHIHLEWGGDWTSFKDWGHFQLPWKDYP